MGVCLLWSLLEGRVKVNQPAAVTQGRTALQAAFGDEHSLNVEFLLEECSMVNSPASYEEERADLRAVAVAVGRNFPIVDRLGAHLKSLTSHKEGKTALQTAAGDQNLPILVHLLGEGARGAYGCCRALVACSRQVLRVVSVRYDTRAILADDEEDTFFFCTNVFEYYGALVRSLIFFVYAFVSFCFLRR